MGAMHSTSAALYLHAEIGYEQGSVAKEKEQFVCSEDVSLSLSSVQRIVPFSLPQDRCRGVPCRKAQPRSFRSLYIERRFARTRKLVHPHVRVWPLNAAFDGENSSAISRRPARRVGRLMSGHAELRPL